MATHRHGTSPEGSPFEGEDRTAEEAALHIEWDVEGERAPRRTDRRRARHTTAHAVVEDRPARHYGFADEEPELGEGPWYKDEALVFIEELSVTERYSFDDDLDDGTDEG